MYAGETPGVADFGCREALGEVARVHQLLKVLAVCALRLPSVGQELGQLAVVKTPGSNVRWRRPHRVAEVGAGAGAACVVSAAALRSVSFSFSCS